MAAPFDARVTPVSVLGNVGESSLGRIAPADQIIPDRNTAMEAGLTSAKVISLMVASYGFSQGRAMVQRDVFDYYHFLHPEWRISAELFEDAVFPLEQRVSRIVASDAHKKIEFVDDYQEFESMQDRFEKPEISLEKADELVLSLTQSTIMSDFGYLLMREGRPKRGVQAEKYNPFLDPFLSYTVYFALEQDADGRPLHTLGVTEICQLYERIGSIINSNEDLGTVSMGAMLKVSARGKYDPFEEAAKVKKIVGRSGIAGNMEDLVKVSSLLVAVRDVHNSR